jgi:ParB family chromosome partitioning protein
MTKPKGGLGKGLSALIRTTPASARPASAETPTKPPARETGEIILLDISRIRPNPYQPRADFDGAALDELKRSIMEKGIIQPITLRIARDGNYELVSGERRIRAALEAGLKQIPSYVIEVKRDEEMLELALIENLQREHLNPIEIAISYRRLIDECDMTQEDVAQKIGKDRTTVTNFLRLLKLPDKVQQSLRKNEITSGHARALVSVLDERIQLKLFERIVKRGLNVRQVEQLVRNLGKAKGEKKVFTLSPASQSALSSVEDKLRQTLGTKVTVDHAGGGKGEIKIEYYSNDDLERLIDLFSIIDKYGP